MDLTKLAEKIIDQNLCEENDDPFFIVDLEDVKNKYENWTKKLPRVVPFYAVKCNTNTKVLQLLSDLGAGFDCASKTEISKILNLNVDPSKIIYAHPSKQVSHLKFSAKVNVRKMTFDCEAELLKIKIFYPDAEVVLRIRFDADNCIANLGVKFGCNYKTEAPDLIKLCSQLNMNLIGIAFHVGSGTNDYEVYGRALNSVRKLFDYAEALDMNLYLVDIGGGFMGHDSSLLENYAKVINAGIERNFPHNDVQFIAEPGRYFVDSAFSLATQIVLKKISDNGQIFYYINESIHMSLLVANIFDVDFQYSVIKKSNVNKNSEKKLSTIWGCTCNSVDKIISDKFIPEMEIGDWMLFHCVGAYSTSMSSEFNGFSNKNFYVISNGRNKFGEVEVEELKL